jgi:hypothetical protein
MQEPLLAPDARMADVPAVSERPFRFASPPTPQPAPSR